MPIRSEVPVIDMLLDPANARLGQIQESQQATALALAAHQGRRLVNLAASIVEKGLDPAQLPVVVATNDKRRRYKVIEGNRRALALKALETPTLIQSALKPSEFKRLQGLSTKFAAGPISEVMCVIYDPKDEAAAYASVLNRHNGAQEGAGLVEWDSDEKDRFFARHSPSGIRSFSGQVLDFLEQVDGAPAETTKIATNVERLVKSAYVQEKLGLTKDGKDLVSYYPLDEVAKGLRKIATDLRTGAIKVPDIYNDQQRRDYIDSFKRSELPTKSKKLKEPLRLTDLPSGKAKPVKPKAKRKAKPKGPRTTVAASDSKINPTDPRINQIYNELVGMSAETFPNAGSVLLRVFLELSVDEYLTTHSLMSEADRRSKPLAARLKTAAAHLHSAGAINHDLLKSVEKVANSHHNFAAGVTTFNQYVHNKYVFPKPTELRISWDELQPFLEAIWK